MGAKIPMVAVYKAILKNYGEVIADFEAIGRSEVTFSFNAFADSIYSEDLLSDLRTIRAKWQMAVAQGVLTEIKPFYSATLHIPALRLKAGVVRACAHTDTHTIINAVKEDC